MKVIKWIVNALGILMAAILSLVLMAMLIVTPVISAGGSFLQAENLQQVVNDIDFTEVIKESIEEESMEGELLNELMETQLMEDLGLDTSVIMAVRALREGILLKALIGVIAVLSILIVLCRFVRFKGFMWLGVGYCLPASMVLTAALFIRNYGAELINESIPEAEIILDCVLSVLTTQMLKGTGVIAGAGVIFILIFAMVRRLHKKKNTIMKAA